MTDKKTAAVLNYINRECREGVYEIIEPEQIIDNLPKNVQITKAELKEIIDNLAFMKKINLKYADINEYCLASVKNTDLLSSEVFTPKEIRKVKKTNVSAFWGAFLGVVAGGLVYEIVIKPLAGLLIGK